MTCKTREAVERGKRDKPHYFLDNKVVHSFDKPNDNWEEEELRQIEKFEVRIDWSTWRRSR